jgi:hypothetical protein
MKPPDLDRIRFVTRHFDELKGLHLAGLGLLFLSIGVPLFRRGSSVAALPVFAVQLALLAGAFVLTLYAKTYYKKRFGEVQPLGEPVLHLEALSIYSSGVAPPVRYTKAKGDFWMFPRMLLIGGFCLIVYVALRRISPTVHMQSTSVLPDFAIGQHLIAIVLASLFLSSWISRGYRLSQAYYLVLGLVMLGLPALGASMGLVLTALRGHPELNPMADLLLPAVYRVVHANESVYLVCGACLLVAGLLDHRQLVQAFKPAVEESSL